MTIMKRLIALFLCLGVLVMTASGCFGAGPQKEATGDEAANKSVSAYKNTYTDMLNYLAAWGYINPREKNKDITYTEMQADLIGAKQGRRFTAEHTKDTVIELYEYDLKALNATADEVRSAVEKNGTFQNLFDETVENVYLSKNKRYMMIYNDKTINKDTKETDDNYKARQEVVEKFTEFDK